MSNDIMPFANTIIDLIQNAKQNALRSVNSELIKLYWNVGKYLSEESEKSSWGDSFVDATAEFIKKQHPEIKGFNRRGLYRMMRFYNTYPDFEFVTTVLSQISWSGHLVILAGAKTKEERDFYIALTIKENYSVRELERQIESAYYQRLMLSKQVFQPEISVEKDETPRFLDRYTLEFLDLPDTHSEKELRRAIVENLKQFILEVGSDFSFRGEEYRVQVGDSDFYIDLLFHHRSLSCLVAFELKIGKFKPEYVSKMNFYLEALDRDHRKENENPSIGVILCAAKNDEVVEFAMSRSLSPTMVAEYSLKLIDKNLLESKLHEINELLLEQRIPMDFEI
jgi:predicted nuclease of restriction endonuclease-like (RecB) superfamily